MSTTPFKDCNEILTKFLKTKDLYIKGTGSVTLTEPLWNASKSHFNYLVCLKSEKGDNIPESMRMDETLERWKNNLNEKDFITKTNSENVERFSINQKFKISIIAKKINNKKVTIVDGLEHFLDLKDVSQTFAKHFACAVTIKEFESKHNVSILSQKKAVFIQGYWIEELVVLLEGELKINKSFINITDKLGNKKKKK